MRPRHFIGLLIFGMSGFFIVWHPSAAELNERSRIAIIMDDMGNSLEIGTAAIGLPGNITYSFLPFAMHSRRLALLASRHGKEIMLHAPMQALSDKPMGSGGLTVSLDRNEVVRRFSAQLVAVPGISGVNNHMGSALTRDPVTMGWLMEALARKPDALYFVDSVTTDHSVAKKVADAHRVPALSRDVFLDHVNSEVKIREQFELLISTAKRRGYAVAIGHPRVNTLKVLRERLSDLDRIGVELVPVSALLPQYPIPRTFPVKQRQLPVQIAEQKAMEPLKTRKYGAIRIRPISSKPNFQTASDKLLIREFDLF
ncbi:MAG: divergent polysaccharide deacetylase family protein [Gammaproteobacteria bacterium]|nr:divergent polysaccharide deacetylase family protein [Gammaproteobacteria bacterium]